MDAARGLGFCTSPPLRLLARQLGLCVVLPPQKARNRSTEMLESELKVTVANVTAEREQNRALVATLEERLETALRDVRNRHGVVLLVSYQDVCLAFVHSRFDCTTPTLLLHRANGHLRLTPARVSA